MGGRCAAQLQSVSLPSVSGPTTTFFFSKKKGWNGVEEIPTRSDVPWIPVLPRFHYVGNTFKKKKKTAFLVSF